MKRERVGYWLIVLALLAIIGYCVYAGVYWWGQPELTSMEVFRATWLGFIPAAVLSLVVLWRERNRDG